MSGHTPIPGFDGYSITVDGCVFSTSSNWRGYGIREMAQQPNASGYPSVRLMNDKSRRRIPVHRLVAIAFIGPRPSSKHEVRHLNGEPTDNRASNLAWGTRADNAADRETHGRTSRGRKHADAIKQGITNSTNPFWRHAR